MNHRKTIFILLCIVALSGMSLLAQVPLTSSISAVGVLGQTDFVTLASGKTAGKLNTPKGIAIDPLTGKLFVADYENRRVLRWSSADKMVSGSKPEAVLGQPDDTTNTAGITSAKMSRPYGITVDGAGRLWVSDLSNNRVLRFDNASTIATGSAANRVLGQPDFATGTVNTGGISASSMSAPIGVFVDAAGRLWVAERDNKRVLRFDNAASKSNGDPADGVLCEPNFTTNTGGLTAALVTRVYGITGDAKGSIWVADRDNNRVLRFDSAATKANGAAASGVLGQVDFVTNAMTRTQAGQEGPRGVFVDASGRLYVSDEGNNRILAYNAAASKANGANADHVIGQADFITKVTPEPPTASSINYPEFLVVDNAKNMIWLADEYNNRILRFDLAPQFAVGVLGQTDFVSGANGLSASKVNTPKGIAIDPTTGKLFVADYENRRVLRWTSVDKMTDGSAAEAVLGQPDFATNSSGISSSKMARPYGITVDASGRLWVSDLSNNRVLRFDNASTIASGSAANRVLGQPDFATGTVNTGGISASSMSAPIGVYIDAAGRLWVAERDNKRVLRFDNAATKSNGDPADGVLGEPNFTSNAGGVSAALITRGYGITGDAGGRIWVADRDNNRVLRFDAAASKANGAAADAVVGQADFVTNPSGRTQSTINGPRGVFINASGILYVSDEGNNRILVFDSAATRGNGPKAANVLGQSDFLSATNANPPTAGSMNYPEFLVVDNVNKHIWLADEYNNRILRFNEGGAPALAPKFTVAPTTISFGNAVVMTSKRDSVTVTNSGTAALVIDSVKSDNAMFTIIPSGTASIAAAGSQKFYVTFAPASAGAKTGTVVFYHNAASKKDTLKVDGTGTTGPVFTEDFTGAAGTLLTAAGWTISGTSVVNPLTITSPGLAFGKYAGSGVGNALPLKATGQDVYTTFPALNQGSVYFSMMLNVDSAGTGDYFAALSPSTSQTNYFARLHMKNSGAGYVVGISKYNEVSGGAQYGATVLNFKTTNLVVVKYTFTGTALDTTNDPISVYVFASAIPAAEPATPEIAAYTNAKTDAVNLGYVTLRQGTTGAAPTMTIDGLRIGTAWATAVPTGVNVQRVDVPQSYELQNNYPNPFNPSTTIGFGLPEASAVSLKIYDVLGREVASLVENTLAAGYHTYNWNASSLSSGMYIYRLSAVSSNGGAQRSFTQVKKLMLQK